MSIYKFKKGDIITRIKPSKPIDRYNGTSFQDRSFIGGSFTFLGIANGCIYIEGNKYKDIINDIFGDEDFGAFGAINLPINLPLDIYDEGWSYYIDPYKIDQENQEPNVSNIETRKILKEQLKIALKKEKYEDAEKIRIQLKKLEK